MPVFMTVEGLKMLATIVTSIGILGGGYLYAGGPVPASREWVLVQNAEIKNRVIELQLQQNTGRRDTFRKEEFDRGQELQKEPTNFAVKKRLDEVRDELDIIKRDRDKLEKERGS